MTDETCFNCGRSMTQDKPLFSNAEIEVIHLVSQGLSNQQCADKRFTTEKTNKFHLTSIFKKLGIRKRTQLIVLVHRSPYMFEPGYTLKPLIGASPKPDLSIGPT